MDLGRRPGDAYNGPFAEALRRVTSAWDGSAATDAATAPTESVVGDTAVKPSRAADVLRQAAGVIDLEAERAETLLATRRAERLRRLAERLRREAGRLMAQ